MGVITLEPQSTNLKHDGNELYSKGNAWYGIIMDWSGGVLSSVQPGLEFRCCFQLAIS